jgi:hypothetical protein
VTVAGFVAASGNATVSVALADCRRHDRWIASLRSQ